MMKIIKLLFIMLASTCVNAFALAQSDTARMDHFRQYSTGFELEHVSSVREQVKRVGWTARSIETQLKQSLGNTYSNPIRTETVKAALLGGLEYVQNAFEDINSALSIDPETQTAQVWFQTLQTYDCLRSLPDSVSAGNDLIHSTDQVLSTYIQSLYKITPSHSDPYNAAIHQAACAYAAVITQDEEQIQAWLHGNETVQPLWKRLSEAVPNEGIGNRDKVLDAYLFTLFSLLRDQPAEDIAALKPWITRSLDVINSYFTMSQLTNYDVMVDDTNRYWHLSAFERYYKDYSDVTSGAILDGLYKTIPRRADMLLFGKVPWNVPQENDIRSASSTIMPRMGYSFLHDNNHAVPVSVFMKTSSHNSGYANLLAIYLASVLNDDNKNRHENNTVFVDQKWQVHKNEGAPQNALITSFVPFEDRGVFLSAHASGTYGELANYPGDYPGLQSPVSHYQRDVYVDSPYIIDWFRVTGGETQDYIYQLPSTGNADHIFDWQPFTLTDDSYPFLQTANSIQSAKTKNVFSVSSISKDSDWGERVWFVGQGESELIHAKQDKQDILINRKQFAQPTANLFAVVHEVAKNKFSNEVTVQPVALNPQSNESGFQAMAIVIKHKSYEDIFYSSTQPGQSYTTARYGTEIEFQSKFAHVQFHEGEFHQMRMVGGTHLKVGDYTINMDEVLTTGVINAIDEKTGSFDLSFPYLLPFGDALKHHIIQAISSEPNTPFLQPLVLSHAEDRKREQRYHLEHQINLSNPPSTLAAPVKNGDQVFFESFAEVKKNAEDSFHVYHSSPIQVTLPANGAKKRLFVNETNVQRLQGDYKDGLIHASFSPLESYDAKIEVIRVQ